MPIASLIGLATSLDIISTMQNYFVQWMNEIVEGLIQVFLMILRGIGNIFLWAVQQVIGGILGFFGVPFTAWSQFVAKNGGWFIPIIFVSILALTWIIGYAFVVVYGFERDFFEGEETVSTALNKIQEEELEG